MAMPGAGPVDDGPWEECRECGALWHWAYICYGCGGCDLCCECDDDNEEEAE